MSGSASAAQRLVALCARRFPSAHPAPNLNDVDDVLSLDPTWDPEQWLDDRAQTAADVVTLTRTTDLAPVLALAAAAMLDRDRYTLARLWRDRFSPSDLDVIAAAACERVPDL